MDYETERVIRDLERRLGFLEDDLRRAKDDLQDSINRKADKNHSHPEYRSYE